MKCVACGSTNLIPGDVGEDGKNEVRFKPEGTPRLKRAFGLGSRRVRAYACAHCHHLQLAVEFKDGDLATHQRFEGRQPSVVERLGSDEE
jgi:hypothetical protein